MIMYNIKPEISPYSILLKSVKNNLYVQLNKHFSVHLPDEDRHK
jgi:hypothetical protein